MSKVPFHRFSDIRKRSVGRGWFPCQSWSHSWRPPWNQNLHVSSTHRMCKSVFIGKFVKPSRRLPKQFLIRSSLSSPTFIPSVYSIRIRLAILRRWKYGHKILSFSHKVSACESWHWHHDLIRNYKTQAPIWSDVSHCRNYRSPLRTCTSLALTRYHVFKRCGLSTTDSLLVGVGKNWSIALRSSSANNAGRPNSSCERVQGRKQRGDWR